MAWCLGRPSFFSRAVGRGPSKGSVGGLRRRYVWILAELRGACSEHSKTLSWLFLSRGCVPPFMGPVESKQHSWCFVLFEWPAPLTHLFTPVRFSARYTWKYHIIISRGFHPLTAVCSVCVLRSMCGRFCMCQRSVCCRRSLTHKTIKTSNGFFFSKSIRRASRPQHQYNMNTTRALFFPIRRRI